jgi:hypothetical protein
MTIFELNIKFNSGKNQKPVQRDGGMVSHTTKTHVAWYRTPPNS